MDLSLSNSILIALSNGVLVGLLLAWYVFGFKSVLTDESGDRSLHHGKAITGAGIFMFLPLCATMVCINFNYWPTYLILAMSFLGLADDKYHLSFQFRLLIQVILVMGCLFYFDYSMGWFFVFLVVSTLWWLNLFNFMDGANGMAGLHVLVITLFYGYLFIPVGNQIDSVIPSVLAVILIYLFFNVYLKKLFMGDSGSLPLALLLVVLALTALQEGLLNYWQIAIIHGAFIVDATLTLIWRFIKKQNITQAHAQHLYQRLIKSNESHLSVSSYYALVTLLLCGVALVMSEVKYYQQIIIMLTTYLVLVVVFMKNLSTGR